MTTLAEVHRTIADSDPGEWVPFSDRGTWTYEGDVALRIERDDIITANLQAPWTRPLPARTESYHYVVAYGSSPVEFHTIAAVDDFRAHIPIPTQPRGPDEPYTITPYEATLGSIVTGERHTLEDYLDRTGIRVREG